MFNLILGHIRTSGKYKMREMDSSVHYERAHKRTNEVKC